MAALAASRSEYQTYHDGNDIEGTQGSLAATAASDSPADQPGSSRVAAGKYDDPFTMGEAGPFGALRAAMEPSDPQADGSAAADIARPPPIETIFTTVPVVFDDPGAITGRVWMPLNGNGEIDPHWTTFPLDPSLPLVPGEGCCAPSALDRPDGALPLPVHAWALHEARQGTLFATTVARVREAVEAGALDALPPRNADADPGSGPSNPAWVPPAAAAAAAGLDPFSPAPVEPLAPPTGGVEVPPALPRTICDSGWFGIGGGGDDEAVPSTGAQLSIREIDEILQSILDSVEPDDPIPAAFHLDTHRDETCGDETEIALAAPPRPAAAGTPAMAGQYSSPTDTAPAGAPAAAEGTPSSGEPSSAAGAVDPPPAAAEEPMFDLDGQVLGLTRAEMDAIFSGDPVARFHSTTE
ncbi:hypothetical protein VTH06DRAFT_7472 [Thermothelomyces fergusii]